VVGLGLRSAQFYAVLAEKNVLMHGGVSYIREWRFGGFVVGSQWAKGKEEERGLREERDGGEKPVRKVNIPKQKQWK
jgi:hypothetical protein